MSNIPPHWTRAFDETVLRRQGRLIRTGDKYELLIKLPRSRKASHLVVELNAEPHMRDWAETSLMADGPVRNEWVQEHFRLPKSVKLEGNIYIKFVGLSVSPIPREAFHTRYPEVPYELAHSFILMHELGHAVNGWKESRADEFAFRRMMIPQEPKAKKLRDAVYGKMKHPMEIIVKLP